MVVENAKDGVWKKGCEASWVFMGASRRLLTLVVFRRKGSMKGEVARNFWAEILGPER